MKKCLLAILLACALLLAGCKYMVIERRTPEIRQAQMYGVA